MRNYVDFIGVFTVLSLSLAGSFLFNAPSLSELVVCRFNVNEEAVGCDETASR